jgi:glycosyltransferase involved in cell wall biosynthesis
MARAVCIEFATEMPLRILHVTPYFADAWGYGGIPRVATALAKGLGARGHAVTVCTTDAADAHQRTQPPSGGATRTLMWNCVDVHTFSNASNVLAYHLQCFLPRGLDRFLATHARQFDIAHLHACRNLPVSIAARRLTAAGVPYVLAPNGTASRLERRRAAKWMYDLTIGRSDLQRAAAILAVSESERTQLECFGVPSARIRVVPNPVNLDEHDVARSNSFRTRHDLRDDPVVLFLGKLTPRKRVDALVRAFARLDWPDARLVIAGNDMGAMPSVLAEVGRAGLAERTRFTGLLRGADRVDALASADVVVYPSSDEVFGLVAFEALLAGTPVVVAGDSGCGEIIADMDGGVVVPVGDDAALSAAIRSILASPSEWRQRAREAAGRVRTRFGGHVIAERLDALYHELVARLH